MPNPVPVKRWSWTKQRVQACQLIAEGYVTFAKVARTVGVTSDVLECWRVTPEFEAKREEIWQEFAKRVMSTGIALKENRIHALERLHHAHKTIVEERTQDARLTARKAVEGNEQAMEPAVPGGSTGFVVIEEKIAGWHKEEDGGGAIFRESVVFDQGLSREYRATLAQVAEETGQAVSKHELTGKDGGPMEVNVGVMDQIAERVRKAKERAETEPLENE